MSTRIFSIFSAVILALTLAGGVAGCASDTPDIDYPAENADITTRVTEAEARSTAETALAGFNDDDYARFTNRWAASMRDGVTESAFREFRKEKLEAVGRFVAIEGVRVAPAEAAGHVRFVFLCKFEKGDQLLAHVYAVDGTEITGVFLVDP